MHVRHVGISLLVTLLLVGCADLVGSESTRPLEKTYIYTAYDSTGSAVVEGELDIHFETAEDDDNEFHLDGTWDLQQTGDTKRPIGPQTGDGELRGTVREDGSVWMNLHPKVFGDRVTLRGAFKGGGIDRLNGEWTYASVAAISGGTFGARAKGDGREPVWWRR